MSAFNPYSPPRTKTAGLPGDLYEGEGLWREGRLLLVRKGAEFPDRCLRCNAPAEGHRFERKLSWHRPSWYLLILFNLIIYVVVALCVRWTARISAPICPVHLAKRRIAIFFGWAGSLAGIALIVLGVNDPDYEICAGIGGILFLVSLLVGVIKSQLLVPQQIDEHFIWLKKVSPEFLRTLPEYH